MEVIYKPRAINDVGKVIDWVESQNTPGSGERWFNRLDELINKLAKAKAKFALCKHPSLAKFNYRCYTYNDWVIAFRQTDTKFEVCRFIWGARLG